MTPKKQASPLIWRRDKHVETADARFVAGSQVAAADGVVANNFAIRAGVSGVFGILASVDGKWTRE
jgi:hypothetical protein